MKDLADIRFGEVGWRLYSRPVPVDLYVVTDVLN